MTVILHQPGSDIEHVFIDIVNLREAGKGFIMINKKGEDLEFTGGYFVIKEIY